MKFTYEDIRTQLAKKIYHPVYFLSGEESYFIDDISRVIEETVLSETEKEFNLFILYGREVTAEQVREQALRYPMMSDYQVVIVREAQDLQKLDELLPYIKQPLQTTILVLCYKGKVSKSLLKHLEQHTCYFESRKIPLTRLPQWVQTYVTGQGYVISEGAAYMLVETIGDDLTALINELQKMMISLPQGEKITEQLVQEMVGFSREFSVYEWLDALSKRDRTSANRIVYHLSQSRNKEIFFIVLPMLFDFFVKVLIYQENTGKVKEEELCAMLGIYKTYLKRFEIAAKNYTREKILYILHQIRIYDLKNKGVDNVSTTPGELLKELNAKILYV